MLLSRCSLQGATIGAAMDESLMDNHPMFDNAQFDPHTHSVTMAEPGLM